MNKEVQRFYLLTDAFPEEKLCVEPSLPDDLFTQRIDEWIFWCDYARKGVRGVKLLYWYKREKR